MSFFNDAEITPQLLARARAGEASAHEAIYRTFSKPAFTLICRIVNRRAVAEELLQDVFVEILRNLRAYTGQGSFAGWVRSIAVSKALMHLRSPWHRRLHWLELDAPETQNSLSGADHAVAVDMDSADLERALSQLSAISRSIVWLHDVEGYTHGEIGKLFSRTPSFSKSQLARAHERLRELLESPTGTVACTPVSSNC